MFDHDLKQVRLFCGRPYTHPLHNKDQPMDPAGEHICCHCFPQSSSDNMLPAAVTLPPDLFILVLSFLPDIRAVATCACVSRGWAMAAGVAVPKIVDLDADDAQAACCLLSKPPRGLMGVENMSISVAGVFPTANVFHRICSFSKALQKCLVAQ